MGREELLTDKWYLVKCRIEYFSVNRFFMKLFRTSNIEIVHYCQTVCGCELSSVLLLTRYEKFIK